MFTRISHDPAVMGGRACIRGMRITVAQVMRLLASGMTHAEIENRLSGGAVVTIEPAGYRWRPMPFTDPDTD